MGGGARRGLPRGRPHLGWLCPRFRSVLVDHLSDSRPKGGSTHPKPNVPLPRPQVRGQEWSVMRSGRHRAAGTGSALRTRPRASRFRLPRGSPPPPGLPAAHCQQPRFHCGTWPVTAAAGSRPGALCQGGQVTRTFRAYAGAHAGDAPASGGPGGGGRRSPQAGGDTSGSRGRR